MSFHIFNIFFSVKLWKSQFQKDKDSVRICIRRKTIHKCLKEAMGVSHEVSRRKEAHLGDSCQIRDNGVKQNLHMTIVKKSSFTLAPIWFPHWPTWMWTISRILTGKNGLKMNVTGQTCTSFSEREEMAKTGGLFIGPIPDRCATVR